MKLFGFILFSLFILSYSTVLRRSEGFYRIIPINKLPIEHSCYLELNDPYVNCLNDLHCNTLRKFRTCINNVLENLNDCSTNDSNIIVTHVNNIINQHYDCKPVESNKLSMVHFYTVIFILFCMFLILVACIRNYFKQNVIVC